MHHSTLLNGFLLLFSMWLLRQKRNWLLQQKLIQNHKALTHSSAFECCRCVKIFWIWFSMWLFWIVFEHVTTSDHIPNNAAPHLMNTVEASAVSEQCLPKWQQQACVWASIKHISWSYIAFQWQAEEGLNVKLQKGKNRSNWGFKTILQSHLRVLKQLPFISLHCVICSPRKPALNAKNCVYVAHMGGDFCHLSLLLHHQMCVIVCLRLLPQYSPFLTMMHSSRCLSPHIASAPIFHHVLMCERVAVFMQDLKQPLCHLAPSFILLCVYVCVCFSVQLILT